MQIVQKVRDFAVKLLNLRIRDRRKRQYVAFLIDSSALELHKRPITIQHDVVNDRVEYNLYTAAGFRVNNPKDAIKIFNPM